MKSGSYQYKIEKGIHVIKTWEVSILDVHGRSRVLGEESDFVLILASSRSFSFTDLGEPSSLRDRFDLDSLRLLSVEDLEDEEFEELLRRLLLGLRP